MVRRRKKPKPSGYVRPSRAKQHSGWSLRELAQLTGLTERTLRLYRHRGVLPPVPFKGVATRYQRRHLLWLLGIRRCLREGLTLAQIRARLQALAAPDLERFASEGLAPGPLATALGIAAPAPPPVAAALESKSVAMAPRRWRIELALGLELHIREDASAAVQALAKRIRESAVRMD